MNPGGGGKGGSTPNPPPYDLEDTLQQNGLCQATDGPSVQRGVKAWLERHFQTPTFSSVSLVTHHLHQDLGPGGAFLHAGPHAARNERQQLCG